MQMRRRSSGAPATDTATSTGTSGKGGGALGPDNSLLQSMIPDSSQQESGFLGSFEQGQAPPELERGRVDDDALRRGDAALHQDAAEARRGDPTVDEHLHPELKILEAGGVEDPLGPSVGED